jgi:hypothetical protein
MEGLDTATFSRAMLESFAAADAAFQNLYQDPNQAVITVNDPSESQGGNFPTEADAFFTTMTQQYAQVSGQSRSVWFDPQFLHNASSQFYTSAAAQFASQYLRQETKRETSGTVVNIEPRLIMTSPVFYAVEILLAIFTVIAIGLAGPASATTMPLDPASIGGTTAALHTDKPLVHLFHGAGCYSLAELKHYLSGRPSFSTQGVPFRQHQNAIGIRGRTDRRAQETSWQPLLLRPILRETILAIPLILIAVLEITLHVSNKNDGLASIDDQRRDIAASRIIPALVFTLVKLLLSSVAFNVNLLAPLVMLRNGPTTAQVSHFDTPLSRFPLHNLFTWSLRRQIAPIASVIMTFAAFFLVTISSGLFIWTDFETTVDVIQVAWFQPQASSFRVYNDSKVASLASENNLTAPLLWDDSKGNGIQLISNSIIELNFSSPPRTYGDIALPIVKVSDEHTARNINATALSVRLPAVRAGLQCHEIDNHQVTLEYEPDGSYFGGEVYSSQYAYLSSSESINGCNETVNNMLEVNLPPRLNTSQPGSISARQVSALGAYCNNIVGLWGYATDEKLINYTIVSCAASFQSIQVLTTLELPGYAIAREKPPIVHENDTRALQSNDEEIFVSYLLGATSLYNNSLTVSSDFPEYSLIDSVTSALMYGRDGIPANEIFDSPPSTSLIPALKRYVGVAGAQYTSYFYRSTNSSSKLAPAAGSTLPGTVLLGPNYRLVQNATSTRILDGLLAAAFVFALITIYTFRSRDVARAELGSLAATFALIADSEIVQELRNTSNVEFSRHSEKMHTEGAFISPGRAGVIVRAQQKLLRGGYQFSLGWWDSSNAALSLESDVGSAIRSDGEGLQKRRRWGIGVGRAE